MASAHPGASLTDSLFMDNIDPFKKGSLKKTPKKLQGSSRYNLRFTKDVKRQATPPLKGKLPRKNSERVRVAINKIKIADDGYEDDIYESKTFDNFKDMFPSDSNTPEDVKTPKLASLLTPGICEKTPAYTNCYSPTEYALNRKIAEKYIYRNKPKKRTNGKDLPPKDVFKKSGGVPEKKKLDYEKAVERALAVQNNYTPKDSSDEKDLYYTDDI